MFYPGEGSSAVGLIATFGTLAAAFAVQPIGGLIFGPLGDRIGRKRVLVTTIAVMAVGTTMTGLLPGYNAIGIWAPLLLVVARLMQGFSTGGEYVGAMTFLGEHATGMQTMLSSSDMGHWGWRIPFLLAVPFGVVALYMRLRVPESPAYREMNDGRTPGSAVGCQQFRQTVTTQWKPVIVCIGLVLTFNVPNYMLTGYLPTYVKQVGRVGGTAGLVMIGIVLVVLLSAVVFVARLSDHIGVKPIIATSCVLLLAVSIPAFLLIRFGHNHPMIFLGVLLIGLAQLGFNSTEPSTLPALFPTDTRYSGVALSFNISVSAFGGTTPLIAQTLVSSLGDMMVPPTW